jgi:hypothetical protein
VKDHPHRVALYRLLFLIGVTSLLLAAVIGISACGDDNSFGGVSGNDGKSAQKVSQAVQECLSGHGGVLAPVVFDNGSYGVTSAVGALCKDGTVVMYDD